MTFANMPAIGSVIPFFAGRTDVNDEFHFGAMGGRWVILTFFGSMAWPPAREADRIARESKALFDDVRASYFGITNDPLDRGQRGLKSFGRGIRYFYDEDSALVRQLGLLTDTGLQPCVFLLDRSLRMVEISPVDQLPEVIARLNGYLEAEDLDGPMGFAPVLTVPRVFEPDLCRRLIDYYLEGSHIESGVMRNVDGRIISVMDNKVKRRTDRLIEDKELIGLTRDRIATRLMPQIERAFRWRATRIERYVVSCYDSKEGGFFRPHRDNTGAATDHRMFAVSLNLNDDFEGGELEFPEYGTRTYKPPLGGATVFSCILMHAATPVTAGVRYAFLPFLYDEERAQLRRAHLEAEAARTA